MNKIHINLNPKKEDVKSILFQNLVSYIPIIGIVIGFLFVAIVVLNIVVISKVGTLRSYERKWRKWEDRFKKIRTIKSETESLLEEEKTLVEIATPRYQMARILGDVFSVLPQNIWFKAINFREGSLDIAGYVVEWEEDYLISVVDRFIRPLREKEYFSSVFTKVNLKESRRKKFYGVEVLEFDIECRN
jgi:Tfp pilus assembly protein PilN